MRVSEVLNNGWEHHGDPTLTFDGKTAIAGHAIVKNVEGESFNKDISLRDY